MAFLTVNLNTRSLSMHATNVSVILPETNDVPVALADDPL